MIKNIVFDMGNVLIHYDPMKVCRKFITGEEERKKVCASVFSSLEWLLLDKGTISEEDALKKMQERLDTEEEKEQAALCLKHWHEYNMWPAEGMEELVGELKDRGFCLYLCSNASLRLLDCWQIIPGIHQFDGRLFSAEVLCMKPEKEMYENLFKRFHLNPEECFFIDDLEQNIQGGKACGMDGYVYDGDLKKLRERLLTLND